MAKLTCLIYRCLVLLVLYNIKSCTAGLVRGNWGSWGSCSACDGQQTRRRACAADGPDETCDGLTSETRPCTKDLCLTTPIIICVVLGALILLAIILLVLVIRRKIKREKNIKNQFNINAAEDYYDRSLRGSTTRSYYGDYSSSRRSFTGSYYGDYPSTTRSFTGSYSSTYPGSVGSSRATLPTIAPYLPDVDEEPEAHFEETNSLPSIQEATMDFEVDNEFLSQDPSVYSDPGPGMSDSVLEDDDGFEARIDID